MQKLKLKKYRTSPVSWLLVVILMLVGLYLVTMKVEFAVLGVVVFGIGCGIMGWNIGSDNERNGCHFEVEQFYKNNEILSEE